jgi:hypothetical protein
MNDSGALRVLSAPLVDLEASGSQGFPHLNIVSPVHGEHIYEAGYHILPQPGRLAESRGSRYPLRCRGGRDAVQSEGKR